MLDAHSLTPTIRRPDVMLIWGTVVAAWIVTLLLVTIGAGEYLVDHDALFTDRSFSLSVGILLFLLSWQLMTAAMMLPSSLPMMVMYRRASRAHAHPLRGFGIFMLGYFVVWTGFAVMALLSDAGVHWLTANVQAVAEQEQLIGGGILVLAGAFQFSSLKERCLDTCRDPMTFFWRYYIGKSQSAWELGIRHGLFCLGCCWALMLTMFAVGMGSLVWMTALTGVMVVEKVTRYGNRLAAPIGVTIIVWGTLIVLRFDWLPAFLRAT